jgi:hypothetical protein
MQCTGHSSDSLNNLVLFIQNVKGLTCLINNKHIFLHYFFILFHTNEAKWSVVSVAFVSPGLSAK